MKKLNIGLIGYKFMGKTHSYAIGNAKFFFKDIEEPVKKVICGRTEHLVKQAAKDFGWEEYCTDWKEVVSRDDIDVVDIVTPTINHMEIAIKAAKSGKHVFCEKPLAMNAREARVMLNTAEKYKIKHMVGYNYRKVPAIGLAKKLISDGKLGEIYHFRGCYLQDWIMDPEFPAIWKLDKKIAGSGPHGDLNAHIIDLARYLVGEIDKVVGMQETFIKERPKPEEEKKLTTMLTAEGGKKKNYIKVTVDDATAFLSKFKSGALGTFEATRFAGGRKNHERIEINGSRGSILFNFEKMNELKYWSKEDELEVQGFRTILVTEEVHPYIKYWWPPGHLIGYQNTFVNEFGDFFQSISKDSKVNPDFYDGWKANQVLDAVSKSIETETWQEVDKM